ncbi:MAG: hypothetical protein QOF76_671 [Solirubrobacteraceae bacterium]|nr:hypothetical protein [Solirubrobacteraceae bacterium]
MSLAATSRLLGEVFPGARIGAPAYLSWLYVESPFGAVVEANLDDDQGRAGHYAIVPCDVLVDRVPRAGALSLNTAVHERARGGGVFVSLAEACYAAARERGIGCVIGVANANSTPGFLKRLGFHRLASLPARVIVPGGRARGVTSRAVDSALLADPAFRAGLSGRLPAPARGVTRSWTPDQLAWRLASPNGAYALHDDGEAALITAVDRVRGVPVTVVLKLLSAGPVTARTARRLVTAAALHHRSPAVLHAGVDERWPLRGVPLPERLRPSPLNFIFRDLENPGAPAPALGACEFLDFDAY